MDKKQFLKNYARENPHNNGIPKFSTQEVLTLMDSWNTYIETRLKPTKREILDEANKQRDIYTRQAFSKGAQWMRETRFRHEYRQLNNDS